MSESQIDIVRVLPNFLTRLDEFSPTLLESKERYYIKMHVILACDRGLIESIGKFDLPKNVKIPYKFRSLDFNPYKGWRKWYMINERLNSRKLVTKIDDQFLTLSSFGIWNPALLKERLEEGWSLENWV